MSFRALRLEPFASAAAAPDAEGAPETPPDAPAGAPPAGEEPGPEAAAALASRLARARGEGRAAGFEEGVAHAEAEGQAQLRVLLSGIREAFEDSVHARMEQERVALNAAHRLAEALLGGVAPDMARRGLAAEVARAAAEAMRAAPAAEAHRGPRIRVAPAQAEAVTRALAGAGLDAPVEPDPSLSDLAARLDWGGGADVLDLEAALAAARQALQRHAPDPVLPQEDADSDARSAAHV